jgi:Fe-S-cluster containining protein
MPSAGKELFPLIDAALASASQRSGHWLACHPGCHQCCIGVFPITALDAALLREGLAAAPSDVRERILHRAHASRQALLAEGFPGNPSTGELFTEADHEEAFADFANNEPCPVLDPSTGTCDLYAHRPVQCRTFGPPARDDEGGLAVCELCFIDAPEEEIFRCEIDQSWRNLEQELIATLDPTNPDDKPTLIAFALLSGV